MKLVVWTDERGWKHGTYLRDTDPDSRPEIGVPLQTPDVTQMDWEGVMRQVNNILVERQITTYNELQRTGALETISNVIKRHVVSLLKR